MTNKFPSYTFISGFGTGAGAGVGAGAGAGAGAGPMKKVTTYLNEFPDVPPRSLHMFSSFIIGRSEYFVVLNKGRFGWLLLWYIPGRNTCLYTYYHSMNSVTNRASRPLWATLGPVLLGHVPEAA